MHRGNVLAATQTLHCQCCRLKVSSDQSAESGPQELHSGPCQRASHPSRTPVTCGVNCHITGVTRPVTCRLLKCSGPASGPGRHAPGRVPGWRFPGRRAVNPGQQQTRQAQQQSKVPRGSAYRGALSALPLTSAALLLSAAVCNAVPRLRQVQQERPTPSTATAPTALTTVRLSLLSAKNRGSIAWKDSSVRPMRPVHTWGLHTAPTSTQAHAAVAAAAARSVCKHGS